LIKKVTVCDFKLTKPLFKDLYNYKLWLQGVIIYIRSWFVYGKRPTLSEISTFWCLSRGFDITFSRIIFQQQTINVFSSKDGFGITRNPKKSCGRNASKEVANMKNALQESELNDHNALTTVWLCSNYP